MGDKSLKFYHTILPFLKTVGGLFYDRRYFESEHFNESAIGWVWVLRGILWQKILGYNRSVPFPVPPWVVISNPDNLVLPPSCLGDMQKIGMEFRNGNGKIWIGEGTQLAPRVGIMTEDHDCEDIKKRLKSEDVVIGENCWIGMGAMILPGVVLGDHTVVGAGAIVTKSFPEGHVVIAGNPAKVIKEVKINVETDAEATSEEHSKFKKREKEEDFGEMVKALKRDMKWVKIGLILVLVLIVLTWHLSKP